MLKESGRIGIKASFETSRYKNKQQQELTDGNQTNNQNTYPGPSSREKPQLEEGSQTNEREGNKTASQNQSQGHAQTKPVEETSKSKFDIAAWKAEMERLYPDETQAIKNELNSENNIQKRVEDIKYYIERIDQEHDPIHKTTLEKGLSQQAEYFKNNMDAIKDLNVSEEILDRIKLEVFKLETAELSILKMAERIEEYGYKLDLCRDSEKAELQKELYQFIKAGQETCPDKLRTIYQASDSAKSIIETNIKDYKDIQTDANKEAQTKIDRGFER